MARPKKDFYSAISSKLGAKEEHVKQVCDEFLKEIFDTLASGERIEFRGLGSFDIVERKAKVGRNPNKKGSEVKIPARCAVKFKPGKELKDAVAKLPVKVEGETEEAKEKAG